MKKNRECLRFRRMAVSDESVASLKHRCTPVPFDHRLCMVFTIFVLFIAMAGSAFAGWTPGVVRYNANGTLDTSFGGTGKVSIPLPNGLEGFAKTVANAPDGKIIIAGDAVSGDDTHYFFVARLLTRGGLDVSFGDGGVVLTRFFSQDHLDVTDVAVDDLGRIVVCGYGDTDIALARYLSDGQLDMNFDRDGKVLTRFHSQDRTQAWGVVIVPNGNILVAGGGFSGDRLSIVLARYNQDDGSLDTSFDQDGKIVPNFPSASRAGALDVAIDGQGRIITAGITDWYIGIVRYLPDGTVDTTYGDNGFVTIDFLSGDLESAIAVAVDDNDRVIVGGYKVHPEGFEFEFVLARTLENGALDASFDGDGKVVTDFRSASQQEIHDIAFLGDDIVAVGWVDFSLGVARYQSDGSLNTAFDRDGKVITKFFGPGSTTRGEGVVVGPNNKIIVAVSAYP